MKRLLTLLALVLCSCAETFVGEEIARLNNENLPDLTASFADEDTTRTYVENNKHLRWHKDDRLTVFYGNTLNRQYKFNGATGDNSGTFSLVPDGMLGTGNTLDAIYAIYPYDENTSITEKGVITLTLPAEQTYAEDSFGRGANTMLAVTENVEDTFLSFKNACGYLKLRLYNAEGATIKSIDVKGNSGERLAGAATATIAFGEAPVLAMADDATTSVTLDCGEGVALGTTAETATEFWIVLPATTFTEGLTITATDTEGGVFEKSTTNEVIIERNAIQPMAALEAKCVATKPANNEIWYTNGSTTEATTPNNTNAFGANIVSNTYDAAKECWVIKFDGDVTTIGYEAFRVCSSLTSVTIPDSVTTIGYWAFYNCSNLTSITIPDSVTTIGDYAFYNCSCLTNIELGDYVTSIGHYAFSGCSSLTSITIPESVIEIENNPFNGCTSLKEFKGPYAVNSGCALVLGELFVAFAPGNNTEEIQINNGITKIAMAAFLGCNTLESIELPESLLVVGDSAFNRCSGLTSITIPKNVKVLGNLTFYNCENLQNVYCECVVPPTCGLRSFYNNSSELKIYVYEECIDTYKAQWENYSDKIVTQGSIPNPDVTTSIYYTTTDEQIVEISTLPIKSNTYNNGLGELVVYGELTSIPTYTFDNCDRLKTITIPNSVTEIGRGALFSCDNIERFSGKFASEDGRYIIIDNTLCYAAKANLPKVVSIPDNIIVIGENAFSDCSTIEEVVIPNSVIKIDVAAFVGCRNLSMVNLGNSVQEILDNAFANTRLGSIYIPKSVNGIGAFAFSSTYSVSFQATTPPSSVAVPYAFPTEAFIYVPNSAKDAYIAQWGGFYSNIVGY